MKKYSFRFILISLLICLVLAIGFSLSWGSYQINIFRIPAILFGAGNKLENIAIFTLRLPRILVAIAVGSALAIAGGLLQTLTKNDLADSGIIGINAGAALGAVLFISMQGVNYYETLGEFSIFMLPVIAIVGAIFASLLVYFLAYHKGINAKKILLIGIGINMAINAVIIFVTSRGSITDYNQILVWISGSLWGSGWKYVVVVIPIVVIIFCIVFYHFKILNIIQLGDEVSTGLGIMVEKSRRKFLFAAVLLAGTATAVAGNISFLGLICPHLARRMIGPNQQYVLPISAILGMIIIVVADAIARNIFSPLELPVGVAISLVGVPYFIYLMLKES